MRVWFAPLDARQHRFRVERAGVEPIDVALETRSLLLHDLAHYAVESAECLAHGFYGLLADGVSLDALREQSALAPDTLDALLQIERRVALTQSAFKRQGPDDSDAMQRLRALWGAWRKTRRGDALQLDWPNAAPMVVAAPPHSG